MEKIVTWAGIPLSSSPIQTVLMTQNSSEPRIEPATLEDMPQLVELLAALFSEEEDFKPVPA